MNCLLRYVFGLLMLWLAAVSSPALAADQVSKLKITTLPPLKAHAGQATLLVLGGNPVVVDQSAASLLAGYGAKWTPVDGRAVAGLQVAQAAGDRARAVVIARDGRLFILSLNGSRVEARQLPLLRGTAAPMKAALAGESISLIGRTANGGTSLFQLSLAAPSQQWSLAPAPRFESAVALAEQGGALYLTTADGRAQRQWRWTAKTGWQARTRPPLAIIGGARPIGQASVLYIAQSASNRTLVAYNGITDAWSIISAPIPSEASAVPYGDGVLAFQRQGDRAVLTAVELVYQPRALGWLDWTIIGTYLLLMLAIGFYFWRRSRIGSTSEFFLGSRTIPFWAAGVSMFATNTSSISYLAVPAKAFDTDWQYMMSKVVTVFALLAVAYWVIPMFRRLNLVSVFSYLETRFHPAIRMLSSALAILMHVGGRMGIVLYLPALAIATITGTSAVFCIVVIGVCTIIYTALGGMKAVVWTDFFQVVVLFGGALFAIGFIVHAIGLTQIYDTAEAFDKTRMLNFSFDFTTPTIWGFIILYTFDTVLTFPKDQVLMQRVLSTSSANEARRSVWLFALILLPAGFVFYIIGTTLFAYYRANPGRLDPLLPVDAVFPAFIGTELPHGLTGIIIAGLFAAAMGTLSGTINSVATLLSVDFYERLRKTAPTQKQSVRFAEWMTVLIGMIGILLAVILSRLDVRSLLDLTIELFGLLGGSCAGAYTLGMFTRRANWQGTAIGIVSATIMTLVCWMFSLVHPYFYLAIAIVSSITIGYLASWLFPRPGPDHTRGLTIYDRNQSARVDLEPERLA